MLAEWISKPHPDSKTILAVAVLILTITGAASFARADSEVALMNRLNAALRGNDRLNGAKAYTAAPGVIVLYGMVFDDKDRALAEQTAKGVNGVTQVVDNLRTKTGKMVPGRGARQHPARNERLQRRAGASCRTRGLSLRQSNQPA
jgi:hypothetical protein